MKNLKKKLYCFIIGIALSLASCSDDDKPTPQVKELPEISLDKTFIDVEIPHSATVNIENGGGEYHVFSANPEIATVELKDHTLAINGISVGKTTVVISDKNNHIKALNVAAYLYKKIVLKQEKKTIEEITINKRLGHQKKQEIIIYQGNGGYQARSENEKIATVTVNDNTLVVTALVQGETTLKVTDSSGFEFTVPVKVTDTTIAYIPKELAEIIANDEIRYFYNGKNLHQIFGNLDRFYQHIHDEKTGSYGFDMVQYPYYFKFHLTDDKSVGKKQGVQLYAKVYFGVQFDQPKDIEFEIIKNDGTKFWAVYSFIEENVLNYGYFCDTLN